VGGGRKKGEGDRGEYYRSTLNIYVYVCMKITQGNPPKTMKKEREERERERRG
jgi:hypothetical protein